MKVILCLVIIAATLCASDIYAAKKMALSYQTH